MPLVLQNSAVKLYQPREGVKAAIGLQQHAAGRFWPFLAVYGQLFAGFAGTVVIVA
jgi:hypothetical protein